MVNFEVEENIANFWVHLYIVISFTSWCNKCCSSVMAGGINYLDHNSNSFLNLTDSLSDKHALVLQRNGLGVSATVVFQQDIIKFTY